KQHREMLQEWNGIGLEIIRFFGCGTNAEEIGRLGEYVVHNSDMPGVITIGSDASGFAYLEDLSGAVYSLHTGEHRLDLVASDLEEFVCDVVFGSRAEQFAGTDWMDELKEHGLV
ncbi:hypothetical protein, partial [Stieleria mannarensis]|uniref:hypothetical protein n=1 Tax=Stieleria mannarensis TaxID=2755585 RepID=UPI00160196FC